MKKTAIIIAASLVVLSCGSLVDRIDNQPTFQQVNTAASIVGDYTLTQAEWQYEIDLTGNGEASYDILSQLDKNGVLGFDKEFAFNNSRVLDPYIEDMTGQVNLYIPLFRIKTDNNTGEFVPDEPVDGMCPMEMRPYQFHYKIQEDGHLVLNTQSVWDIVDNTIPYYVIQVEFESGSIKLTARTLMFNRASGKWQEGRIKCEYVRR